MWERISLCIYREVNIGNVETTNTNENIYSVDKQEKIQVHRLVAGRVPRAFNLSFLSLISICFCVQLVLC